MPVSPVRDEYVVAGDLTFHYVQWGEQGSPIICPHGLTANAYCFQALADELAGTHRVFAYDLRGRGDSDKPASGYSLPIHAEDLAEIIDALELERPIVMGHSLGAMIALYFAAHHPDKLSRLILIDAGGRLPWNSIEEQPLWLTASISRLGTTVPSYEEFIQRLKAAPFIGPYWNENLDIYFEHDVYRQHDGSVISKCSPSAVHEDQMDFHADYKPELFWSRVTSPTLLLRAGKEVLIPNDQVLTGEGAEEVHHAIRDCQYVNYPDLNHYTIVFRAKDGPAQAVRDFVGQEP